MIWMILQKLCLVFGVVLIVIGGMGFWSTWKLCGDDVESDIEDYVDVEDASLTVREMYIGTVAMFCLGVFIVGIAI